MFEEVGQPDEAGDSFASDVTASLSLSLAFVTLQPRVSRNYCVSGRKEKREKKKNKPELFDLRS